MAEHRIRYLSRRDVEGLGLGMAAVIDAVEEAFREKGPVSLAPTRAWTA